VEILRTKDEPRFPKLRSLLRGLESEANWIVKWSGVFICQELLSEDGVEVQWRLMQTAVALARYRGEKGKLPQHLSDLIPGFLPAIPKCPTSGVELGYSGDEIWAVTVQGETSKEKVPDEWFIYPLNERITWELKR
jgi:hypothetical protein